MHIWQACRATSAALTFFEPITIGKSRYSDGGLLENNPVQQVHGEASEVFEDREQILISLGTGTTKSTKFDPNLLTVADSLARLATDTERTADAFYRREDAKAAKAGQYFRFNVPGLGDIGLEESARLHDIELETEKYLNNPEVGQKVVSCVQKLSEGASRLPEIPSGLPETSDSTSVPLSDQPGLEQRLALLRS